MIPLDLVDIRRVLKAMVDGPQTCGPLRRISIDSRTTAAGDLFFAIPGARFDGHDFVSAALARGAAAAVVRRDFSRPAEAIGRPLLRVDNVVEALGQLAGYHRGLLAAQVIAITGSVGKTTTRGMIAQVLGRRFSVRSSPKSFNNQIGVPLTLLSATADDEFLVVEVGSNAPGEVAGLARIITPDIGVVTAVGHAHLEGLGGLEGVRAEKLSLFGAVRPHGLAVVHAGAENGPGAPPRRADLTWITFGMEPFADLRVHKVQGDLGGVEAQVDSTLPGWGGCRALRLAVPGPHNALNAAAALAVGRHCGLIVDEILAALAEYCLPDLRLNVRRYGGITVIDDCYNANPSSMAAALEVLRSAAGRRVFVAGAMAELGSASRQLHHELGRQAARAGVDLLVTVGAGAEDIAAGARSDAQQPEIVGWADAREAGQRLHAVLRDGDTVLIKGSRVAGLEVLAARLAESLPAAPDRS